MKKIIIFAFLFQLLSCIKADVKKALDEYGLTDNSPSASTISATISEDTATLVTLSYTDFESDIGTACTLSSLLNLTGTCSCTSGTCQANVTGTLNFSGAASFSYTVTANGLVSNTASASITITAATIPLVDGVSSDEHRLFISSSSHTGNLGGRIGADSICQNLAITAGLTRDYKALLSTSNNNVIENYTHNGRIYAFDSSNTKTLIANSLTNFVSGDLISDPIWNEFKIALLGPDDPGYGLRVWTGYISDSAYAGIIRTCADWTSSSYDNGNSNAGFMGYPQNVECKNTVDPNDFMADMMARNQNTKAECEDAGFTWTRNTGRYTFEISNGGSTCGDANRIYCISM